MQPYHKRIFKNTGDIEKGSDGTVLIKTFYSFRKIFCCFFNNPDYFTMGTCESDCSTIFLEYSNLELYKKET
jgi:hypothetical protein